MRDSAEAEDSVRAAPAAVPWAASATLPMLWAISDVVRAASETLRPISAVVLASADLHEVTWST
jgi:hypothetical protein